MITLSPVYCFAIFLQLNVVVGIFCGDKNCKDCASNTFLRKTCRWCRRDNECHVSGAPTNKCKRAENIVNPSRCGEELPQYNPELSLKMLLLSAAAYDPNPPQKCLDNSLPSDHFQIQRTVTKECDFLDNQCSGYVAVSHTLNVIVIAFRGSECFEQAFIEFVEGLVSPKKAFLSNGEVQTYWKRGFEKLWPSMESKVKALIADNPSYKIWVTGHSLGGAIASFWEKDCVHSTRKKRETPGKYNNALARDPRCSKKNTKEARSSSARARSSNMSQFERSLFCFVVFFISTALQ